MDHLSTYMILFLFITSFYTIELVFCSSEQKSEKTEEDESEWRVLGKDETVPRGSHVQLDLTTGERRIKVIRTEKTERDETSVMSLKTDEEVLDQNSYESINSRLRHIVGDDPKESDDENNKNGGVKHKFRSYDELKKDFEDLHMAVKTDIEIMNNILENYKELVDDKVPVSEEIEGQQITMLTDLEYLLHQIDNANEFVKNGGLTNIILPSLNSTSTEVRSGTARLLGSAAQSNIAVQIAALESGAIGVLLRILVLDKTPSVRSSTLYALSCLIRSFPTAQKKFVDEGGLTVLYNLFSSDSPDKLKIQVKVLNLIHDLIVEKQDAEKAFTLITKEMNSNSSAVSINEAKERLRQYNLIGLETRLQEQHWCNQLSSLLIDHFSQHVDVILNDIRSKSDSSVEEINIEHDVIEKVIEAMISSSNLCLSDYEDNHKLKEVIHILQLWYKKLSRVDEGDDKYYEHLSKSFETLIWKYKIPINEHLKDEL